MTCHRFEDAKGNRVYSHCQSCGERDPQLPPDTVYAHVERTVHALLDVIIKNAPTVDDKDAPGLAAEGIKLLAEAVQALSSWPQFNPMNSHEQYQKLAEYAVEKALKAYQDSPKMPACDCGVGVQMSAGFHLKGCKGFLYPEVKAATCPCGFGTAGRSLHTPGCPRVQENDR